MSARSRDEAYWCGADSATAGSSPYFETLTVTTADFAGFPFARTVTMTLQLPAFRPRTPELDTRQNVLPDFNRRLTDDPEGRVRPDALVIDDIETVFPRTTDRDGAIDAAGRAGDVDAAIVVGAEVGTDSTGAVQFAFRISTTGFGDE